MGVDTGAAAGSVHTVLHAVQRQAGQSLDAGLVRRLHVLRRIDRDGVHQRLLRQSVHDVRAEVRHSRSSTAVFKK